VLVVFISNLARPALVEAEALGPALGLSPYDARLVLAVPPPIIVLTTTDPGRANDVLGILRSRGHGAHIFDDANFVPSDRMTKADDFVLDADGMRRAVSTELLPYGDVYAILRAVHDTTSETERQTSPSVTDDFVSHAAALQVVTKHEEREPVVYFFRRSGERPWLLRERHSSYVGLGDERTPVAFANFARTIVRMRASSSMAVYDDRLARRRVTERLSPAGAQSPRDGMDLLAHLLAMTIASQGGSPYR
jgi:L-fucose mutarotase/ribose pyranase (RbsD/FucU family)